MSAVGSGPKASAAELKAKIIAAAILGAARSAYAVTVGKMGLTEGRKSRRKNCQSGRYMRPEDFYSHGSKTFLKNKRKGF